MSVLCHGKKGIHRIAMIERVLRIISNVKWQMSLGYVTNELMTIHPAQSIFVPFFNYRQSSSNRRMYESLMHSHHGFLQKKLRSGSLFAL